MTMEATHVKISTALTQIIQVILIQVTQITRTMEGRPITLQLKKELYLA
jgi:hypothetical protein